MRSVRIIGRAARNERPRPLDRLPWLIVPDQPPDDLSGQQAPSTTE
jgi:hypothetical protein